jgi:hypothetical protein
VKVVVLLVVLLSVVEVADLLVTVFERLVVPDIEVAVAVVLVLVLEIPVVDVPEVSVGVAQVQGQTCGLTLQLTCAHQSGSQVVVVVAK